MVRTVHWADVPGILSELNSSTLGVDGGTLALDHLEPTPEQIKGPERWLVLFTGLCGNSEDSYIQSCAR